MILCGSYVRIIMLKEIIYNMVDLSLGGVGMQTFFSVLILVSSVSLIISVLLQEGADEGLGSIGGGNAADSLWGRNRGTSKEAILQKITIVAAAVFIISAIVLAAK